MFWAFFTLLGSYIIVEASFFDLLLHEKRTRKYPLTKLHFQLIF